MLGVVRRINLEFAGLPLFVWLAIFVAIFSGAAACYKTPAQKKQWDPHTVIASLLTGIVVCLAVLSLRVF